MARKNDCWGIEVGANAIKAIRLVKKGDEVTLEDFDVIPFKKILTTPDLNVVEAIQVNLLQFLSSHNVSRSTVVVSVPGHTAFARFAKLPPVEPKRIPDIVRFEAVQQIPFPIEEVEWDYQVFAKDDSPDVEVGIFAITKSRVEELLENYRAVELHLDGLTLSPLAVYNAMAYDLQLDEVKTGVILMDIGASSTDVIIVQDGNVWLRTLPIGGNNFTEALVRSFKLSFSKAEKLKREARTSKYARQIFSAMRPVFADLVQEMQRSLGFYSSINRNADITKIVGMGSTFRLPGMTKFLKQQLQMDIVRLDGFKRVTMDAKKETDFADHAVNMATAYGLALQGLELETITANIMPAAVLKKRLWKAKQPWMFAAGLLVILPAVAASVRLATEQSAWNQVNKSTDGDIANATGRANELKSEWEKERSTKDPRDQIAIYNRVLDYRTMWKGILADINMAAGSLNPQPELLGSDYELISLISRHQRRHMHIENIQVDFIPATLGGNDPWKPDTVDKTLRPGSPKYRVVVTGSTPNGKGLELIDRSLKSWLLNNTDRPDRPYTIIAKSVDTSMRKRRSAKDGGNDVVEVRTNATVRPGTGGIRPGGRVTAAPQSNTASPLLAGSMPQRPLLDEDNTDDWLLTITWDIEIRRPNDARAAESPIRNTQESGDGEAEDGAGVPAPSAAIDVAKENEVDG